jgi:molybdopterin biosynthesis enzyme MoaB
MKSLKEVFNKKYFSLGQTVISNQKMFIILAGSRDKISTALHMLHMKKIGRT